MGNMTIWVDVHSDDRQVGKTTVAAALIRMLQKAGVKVEVRSTNAQMERLLMQRAKDLCDADDLNGLPAVRVIVRDETGLPRPEDSLQRLRDILREQSTVMGELLKDTKEHLHDVEGQLSSVYDLKRDDGKR